MSSNKQNNLCTRDGFDHQLMLTAAQVGELCGVSTRTVNRWVSNDGLATHHLPGRGGRPVLMVHRHDLDEWLGRFRVDPKSDDGSDKRTISLAGRRFFGDRGDGDRGKRGGRKALA